MVDTVSREKRSAVMALVKQKNTKPELRVRQYLHAQGFRYSLHRKDLPGKPDIVLVKHRTVIFVHGCFWHGHENCKLARIPKSNVEFWLGKIKGNMKRDIVNKTSLRELGWKVIDVWECQLKEDDLSRLPKLIAPRRVTKNHKSKRK